MGPCRSTHMGPRDDASLTRWYSLVLLDIGIGFHERVGKSRHLNGSGKDGDGVWEHAMGSYTTVDLSDRGEGGSEDTQDCERGLKGTTIQTNAQKRPHTYLRS
eukprot:CAMPEP_0174303086 /NCGR_PEP_ID=MMETSP0809-20121228/59980_1 /TAXON_ID=73025 ORGANISM="Eutreptiella gymnastica-like, Strain CCMP1594" /NCGR_SAMPLE_ID=MMETSP0809 /ASSEMBLY_ACC=CAM_ASM_000658 /LENGTH=102 /DNA_ID=CAMNT_0015409053 /DNA_START=1545 /DNA_END=1851 /DNA_ORIENTATION=-